jgi:pimeloyl-ACP methyl ester carboxylesterase
MSGDPDCGAIEFATIECAGPPVRIEHQWHGRNDPERCARPLMIFLHEGLGSTAMWRDFPGQLCRVLRMRGLVYSRPGYGRSTPRARDERWPVDFMHRQALAMLPAFLRAVGVDPQVERPWLFGHSDGGSIALLYAARFATVTAGLVLLAPHIVVEDISVLSIAQARRRYLSADALPDLRSRLARWHDDPDSAFWGWNDIWLDPHFRSWTIVPELSAIRAPVLAMQGLNDEYGTLEQIRGIARVLPETRLVELPECGHSPQRDQPQRVVEETQRFVAQAAVAA